MHTCDACDKSSQKIWKEKLCQFWCGWAQKHAMTLAVKMAKNLNANEQIFEKVSISCSNSLRGLVSCLNAFLTF